MSAAQLPRRTLLAGAAATAVVASIGLSEPTEASAVGLRRSLAAPQMPSLGQAQLRRLSFGLTRQLEVDVAAAGGVHRWIADQFAATAPDPVGDQIDSWLPYRLMSPADCVAAWRLTKQPTPIEVSRPCRFAMRAAFSERQLFERTVGFWNNHFNVPAHVGGAALYGMPQLDELIRANTWTTFEQLLFAVTTSRSMYCYLNADVSTAADLNENLGRELLELHTVGVAAGYTETMVHDSARILTGWVPSGSKGETLVYNPSAHSTGPVQVLAFADANGDPDGRVVLQNYLSYLAHHRATGVHLATQLIQYFCTDTPSVAHINSVADAYIISGTDIKTTLQAVFNHPGFATMGAKVANPQEGYLSAIRLRGYVPAAPDWSPRGNATNPMLTLLRIAISAGQPVLGWQTPDGYPLDSRLWENSGAYLDTWSNNLIIGAGIQAGGFSMPSIPHLLGLPRRLSFHQAVEAVAAYVWRQPGDARLHAAARTVMHTPDESVVLTPSDWRYDGMQIVFGLALNHPLMAVR